MTVLEWVAVVVAALALVIVLALGGLFLRRGVLQREGGFDMCLRLGGDGWGGGWVFGVGRYRGNDLEWFRTFSYGGRPRQSLHRPDLAVLGRRRPDAEEAYDLPVGHVVLTCEVAARHLDVSMTEPASMAFLAWLEAAPPGGHLVA
ncbi:MAG: DUF2550 domain-containing protein [Jiangellaceae bacterium]